jgi:hypothetical protein
MFTGTVYLSKVFHHALVGWLCINDLWIQFANASISCTFVLHNIQDIWCGSRTPWSDNCNCLLNPRTSTVSIVFGAFVRIYTSSLNLHTSKLSQSLTWRRIIIFAITLREPLLQKMNCIGKRYHHIHLLRAMDIPCALACVQNRVWSV